VSPAHHAVEHRWRIIAVVVLVLTVVGAVAASRGSSTATAPAVPAAQVSAADAESSAWYCAAQSTSSSVDQGSLFLTNTSARPVAATVDAVTDTGVTEHVGVTVGAHSVVSPQIPAPASGSWSAQTVVLEGGGVAVSQVVHDSSGWAAAPCVSSTSSQWYLPEGSTSGTDQLFVAVLNPTSTAAVVDLSFVTPSGVVHPLNDQGVVVAPGQLAVESVAPVVQDQSTVSTIVSSRTGRVVVGEVEQVAASSSTGAGLWLVPGEPGPQASWTIPSAQETAGGISEIDVLNPGGAAEAVTVRLRLASGPIHPLTAEVGPGSTWVLATSAQTRVPDGVPYSAVVSASGGSGVVVGRRVSLPTASPAPQDGAANAMGGLTSAAATRQWLIPPPATSTTAPVSGAAPHLLSLHDESAATESYRVVAVSGSSVRTVALGSLGADSTVVVSGAPLAAAGLGQIEVRSSGAMAVSEDVGPTGGLGVVTMPGLAQAADIAGG
jgi:Family of unknown function (DUF5719)